jgi:putative Holliday junction resolvase
LMAKVLGIDFGDARIGLAVADDEIGIAHPHSVIDANPDVAGTIAGIIRDEGIETIVIGLPIGLDGTEGRQAQAARRFAEQVAGAAGVEIIFQDERLSSVQAEGILLKMDKSRDERKELADAHQAAIILQTYLDSKGNGNDAWHS